MRPKLRASVAKLSAPARRVRRRILLGGGGQGLKGVVEFFKAGPIAETWWREPALLFAGYYAIVNPSTMRRFLDSLGLADEDPSDPDVRLAAAEVAATALLEWDPDDSGGQQGGSAKRIQALFADRERMTRSRPALRARAGVTLAQLGDPRREVLDPDFMEFCLVPGGEFRLGSGDEDELAFHNEKEKGRAQRYQLDYGYWMARFPVTNAQFERFVKDKGYGTAQYWPEAQAAGGWRPGQVRDRFGGSPRQRPFDLGTGFGLTNHPVVGVTWYEALAYTRWLTERWRVLGFIGADQEVTLPSEPEWEKAARGGLEIIQADSEFARPRPARTRLPTLDVSKDRLAPNEQSQRRYPWGPDHDPNWANYKNTGIGTTSAVGIFPGGASPYGCEEMSGNCWEWTRSLWGDYPYPESPGDLKKREALDASRDQGRVLRGGGFYYSRRDVRCAYRSRSSSDARTRLIGFRVVVRPLL